MHLDEVDMARIPSRNDAELSRVLRLIPRRWRVFVFVIDRAESVAIAIAMAPATARLALGIALYINTGG